MDIPPRNEVEQALTATQQKLYSKTKEIESIFKFSLDIICLIDIDGKFINISDAILPIWGYAKEELIGFEYIKFVHPEDIVKTQVEASKIIKGNSTLNFENRYIHKNGRSISMMWSAHWSEEMNTMFCIARDVSDRNELEKKLKHQEKKYKILIEHSSDITTLYDKEGTIIYESPAILKSLGYTTETFIGKKIWDLLHPEDLVRIKNKFDSLINFPDKIITVQQRLKHENGDWIWTEGTMTNLLEEEGVQAIVSNLRNITQRKNAEKLLEELNSTLSVKAEELENSNKELERFAYIASHDLQEPLRMVSSFLELLEKKYGDQLDAQAKKYIYFARDGSYRMKKLILDLLDYSRIGSEKDKFQMVDVSSIIKEIEKIYQVSFKENNASLAYDKLPVIIGIKNQIHQLFQNIIGNAIKYKNNRGDNPLIKINYKEDEDKWLFSIEDNGIGIEPKFLNKIFILFQRLHSKQEYSGTGIGLAISKKIIEKHGGKIWVESVHEAGSTFYFSISKNLTLLKND
jgi:PAS domain S-box-containing protein